MAENPLGTNNITYCNVTSERGSFRSRSVTVVDLTQQGLLALILIITDLLRLVDQSGLDGLNPISYVNIKSYHLTTKHFA